MRPGFMQDPLFFSRRPGAAARTESLWQRRWALSTEALVLAVCVFLVTVANQPFWHAALAGRHLDRVSTWVLGVCLAVLLIAAHFILAGAWVTPRLVRPWLALLLVLSAAINHSLNKFGNALDADWLRAVLATDWHEARDQITPDYLWPLLWQAVLPIAVMSRIAVTRAPWTVLLRRRLIALLAALLAAVLALWMAFQPISAMVRNHKPLRYLVTPANLLYGLGRVVQSSFQGAPAQQVAVGLDARRAADAALRPKPPLLLLVVGETARAASWGLNGYARQNTPELAALDVLNFNDVTACGTQTEVSLPCMFSPLGRRQYDEAAIRSHESLLHVLARAGVDVLWRDNQSGCKGVCAGLPTEQVDAKAHDSLCSKGQCFDEVLLQGLAERLAEGPATPRVIVLHQLGNHGPAYYRRYPPAFRRYTPTCDTAELNDCTREQIVNSYDNAIAYTDHVLAETVRFLQAQSARYETAMLYVSDHGESLGENGLFLHAVPFAIAPDVQKKVPMVMWLSDGFLQGGRVDAGCLRRRTREPASHDHLFHTVLGLMDVQTQVYEAGMDLMAPCRSAPAAGISPVAAAPAASR
jgi:lipid A ethanolaminephosphotransferase